MITNQDYRNVFGRGVSGFLPRVRKAFSVLNTMMLGSEVASSRLPVKLQIEVTDKCNFDCIMCDRLTREHVTYKLKNDVRIDQFEKLISEINPYYITVNGLGEPLMNKDIGKILKLCRESDIKTSMPNNLSIGKVLNTKVLENPPSIITFSIHGGSKEIFEAISLKSNFEKCMEALRVFLEHVDRTKTEIRVLCVLQKLNLWEHKKMYQLLERFSLLKNFVLVPVFDYGPAHSDRTIPTVEEKERALAAVDVEIELAEEERKKVFLKNWKRVIQDIKKNEPTDCSVSNKPCLVPWFETYISAKGDVLPCSYLTNEQHIMGNINDTSFDEIWNGEEYRKFRGHLRDSRGTLSGCKYCPRDDSSRLERYGRLWKRSSLWDRD